MNTKQLIASELASVIDSLDQEAILETEIDNNVFKQVIRFKRELI